MKSDWLNPGVIGVALIVFGLGWAVLEALHERWKAKRDKYWIVNQHNPTASRIPTERR